MQSTSARSSSSQFLIFPYDNQNGGLMATTLATEVGADDLLLHKLDSSVPRVVDMTAIEHMGEATSIGLIVGVVVGSLLILGLAVLLIVFLLRRKRVKRTVKLASDGPVVMEEVAIPAAVPNAMFGNMAQNESMFTISEMPIDEANQSDLTDSD
jgi:hypothetical protein